MRRVHVEDPLAIMNATVSKYIKPMQSIGFFHRSPLVRVYKVEADIVGLFAVKRDALTPQGQQAPQDLSSDSGSSGSSSDSSSSDSDVHNVLEPHPDDAPLSSLLMKEGKDKKTASGILPKSKAKSKAAPKKKAAAGSICAAQKKKKDDSKAFAWALERLTESPEDALQKAMDNAEAYWDSKVLEDAKPEEVATSQRERLISNLATLQGEKQIDSQEAVASFIGMLKAMEDPRHIRDKMARHTTIWSRCFAMDSTASTLQDMKTEKRQQALVRTREKFEDKEETHMVAGGFAFSNCLPPHTPSMYQILGFFDPSTKRANAKSPGKWLALPLQQVKAEAVQRGELKILFATHGIDARKPICLVSVYC